MRRNAAPVKIHANGVLIIISVVTVFYVMLSMHFAIITETSETSLRREAMVTANIFNQRNKPPLLNELIQLYETLPSSESDSTPPPFRDVSHAFPRKKTLPLHHSITLVTQISIPKLSRLLMLFERWNGPISCAVHIPSLAHIQELCLFVQSASQGFRDLVTFHVMLEKPSADYDYPINHLRNLALHNIETDLFLYADVDFMPKRDAHEDLARFLAHWQITHGQDVTYTTVFVLPAFEILPNGNDSSVDDLEHVPETKLELMSMIDEEKAQSFHVDFFAKGHGATDYWKWYHCKSGDSYGIDFHWSYEPYIIANRYGIPSFIEKFRGYGEPVVASLVLMFQR